jgi:hypothetical protein
LFGHHLTNLIIILLLDTGTTTASSQFSALFSTIVVPILHAHLIELRLELLKTIGITLKNSLKNLKIFFEPGSLHFTHPEFSITASNCLKNLMEFVKKTKKQTTISVEDRSSGSPSNSRISAALLLCNIPAIV